MQQHHDDHISVEMNDNESSNLSELIAQTALQHYNRLPSGRGKPQINKEWTVYSALVATIHTQMDPTQHTALSSPPIHAWVVSCATGTKCTSLTAALENLPKDISTHTNNNTIHPNKGRILKDSHAEVLTKRGFMRVLWKEILYFLKQINQEDGNIMGTAAELSQPYKQEEESIKNRNNNNPSLLSIHVSTTCNGEEKSTTLYFELKPNIQLHLYISDSPCGDASIYELDSKYQSNHNHNAACTTNSTLFSLDKNEGIDESIKQPSILNFTGAKIIVPHHHHHHDDPSSLLTLLPPFIHSNNPMVEEDSTHLGNHSTQIAREVHTQVLSALRLKSCRSNIPSECRTQSLSCSDKLVRWIVLGLQGSGPLTAFIPRPIRLTSIVVSQDPRSCCTTGVSTSNDTQKRMSQVDALKRAIYHRAYKVFSMIHHHPLPAHPDIRKELPNIFIATATFACSKAMSEKNKVENISFEILPKDIDPHLKKKRKLNLVIESSTTTSSSSSCSKSIQSPCGVCLNWQEESMDIPSRNHDKNNKSVEVIVGAKGILQGKLPKTLQDVKRLTSRLSREEFRENILEAMDALSKSNLKLISGVSIPKDYVSLSYQQLKQNFSLEEARDFRQQVLLNKDGGPLGGWITTAQEGDFIGEVS